MKRYLVVIQELGATYWYEKAIIKSRDHQISF